MRFSVGTGDTVLIFVAFPLILPSDWWRFVGKRDGSLHNNAAVLVQGDYLGIVSSPAEALVRGVCDRLEPIIAVLNNLVVDRRRGWRARHGERSNFGIAYCELSGDMQLTAYGRHFYG